MRFGKMGALFGKMGANGKPSGGGPFLLLVNGSSELLLANGTDKLLITGQAPSGTPSEPFPVVF